MCSGFIYLLLYVVIGFGYCNHCNLTFCWAKRFVYNWFGMDWREICWFAARLLSRELSITCWEKWILTVRVTYQNGSLPSNRVILPHRGWQNLYLNGWSYHLMKRWCENSKSCCLKIRHVDRAMYFFFKLQTGNSKFHLLENSPVADM